MNASKAKNLIVKLTPPPRPTKDAILGFNFGIRPYRKGGVRMERQEYKNKIFYHNYGHGGAGVSLAYGCATHIVEVGLKDIKQDTSKDIAIIGCGYMGLMQSIILKDLGFKVTVYTKEFPKKLGVYDETPCITSQVAGGLWMPFGVDIQNKPLHFLLAKATYDYYKECIEKKKYQGLSYKQVYLIGVENPITSYCPPDLLKWREVHVDFGNGKLHDATNFTSIMMDGDVFLKELFEEAQSKGVNFISKGFANIDDICKLEEKYIFNCSGASSYYLFNDTNIVPIVGHILYLKKAPGVDYFLSSITKGGVMRCTLYPQMNKLAVGLTYEERGWLEKPDPKSVEILVKNLEEFLDWRVGVNPEPKL